MKALITNGEDWVTLAATRSLGRKGVKVTVSSHQKKAMTFHSKYCSDRAIYPDTKKVGDKVSDYLLDFVKKNKFDVFFPGQENILIPISKNKEKFMPYVNVPIPDFETMDKADDKSKTNKAAEKAGLKIPRTLYMEDLESPGGAVKDLEFPVVIKPYRGAGSAGQSKVYDPKRVETIFRDTVKRHGPSMIQEYITGEKFAVSVLMSENHRPLRLCTQKQVRQHPLTGGPPSLAETVHYPKVTESAVRLLEYLKWQYLGQMEMIVDNKGEVHLIEINPRFYGSISLAIAAGVDYPWLLYRMATGEKVEKDLSYKIGVRSRLLYPLDMKHLIDVLRGEPYEKSKQQTVMDFMKFGGTNYYTLSADDPLPAIFMTADSIFGTVSRKLGLNRS